MHGLYTGVCQRAPHEGDVLQPCHADIGHVLAASTHEAIVFFAKVPGSDALSGVGPRIRRAIAFSARHLSSPLEPDLRGYAATAWGSMGATASWRTPARKQNTGCNRLSATTSVFSLSRKM